jgi:hypothetical protein
LENVINFNWVGIETLAVVLAIIYLFLAIKENSLCWYFVFLSAAIYIWILLILAFIWPHCLIFTMPLCLFMVYINGGGVALENQACLLNVLAHLIIYS